MEEPDSENDVDEHQRGQSAGNDLDDVRRRALPRGSRFHL